MLKKVGEIWEECAEPKKGGPGTFAVIAVVVFVLLCIGGCNGSN